MDSSSKMIYSSGHFEGPEKKLEIILSKPLPGLRDNRTGRWDGVARAAGAEVVSRMACPEVDAYLLSESSLFVWDDRILMITCGKTVLVNAISEILSITGKSDVAFVFYERKNLMFPDDQQADFEADVARIETLFPGKSYRLGPANHDHVHVFLSPAVHCAPEEDLTLQVLMENLAPEVMDCFSEKTVKTPEAAEKLSGLDHLFCQMDKDRHLFIPGGYSLNAVEGPFYATIHVTPQIRGSYTSFETNLLLSDYSELVAKIVNVFKPARFSVVITTSMTDNTHFPLRLKSPVILNGFARTEKSAYEFDCGFGVQYFNYVRH